MFLVNVTSYLRQTSISAALKRLAQFSSLMITAFTLLGFQTAGTFRCIRNRTEFAVFCFRVDFDLPAAV